MPLPLLALAVAAFGIGTTEFIIMGILPDVARDLHVTVPQAGYLVSAYAYGVAFGAPFVAIATARLPRKTALLVLMGIFLLGNIGCAMAPTYPLLMAARLLTALAHGAFFGIGSVVARDIVPPAKRAQAVALMFSGLTLANVLGVPFGTAVGQAAGWRMPFWIVTGIGVLAALAIMIAVPAGLAGSEGGVARELKTIREPRVLLPMTISVLSSMSLFAVLTYITPLLEEVTRLTPHQVTYALILFGVGITIGNLAGGWLADRQPVATLVGAFASVAAVLAVFLVTSHALVPAMATVGLWGAVAFSVGAPLQIWVVEAAADAPNLASTLNQGAFNFGNATGAWIGGMALTAGLPYDALPLVGIAVILAALGVTLTARRAAEAVFCPAR